MSELSIIGKPVPRLDALKKVTGQAQYVDDLLPANCLGAKIVRSPVPHALIRRINLDKARQVPGVKEIIIGADFPGPPYGILVQDEVPLAREKVRFIGEPVAAVAATSLAAAEEAAGLIKVEYEELEPIFDPLTALDNLQITIHPPGQEGRVNLAYSVVLRTGDMEKAFAEADQILENSFATQGQVHGGIELRGAVASVDAGSKLTLWTGNKNTYGLRKSLSEVLNYPATNIRVIQTCIGADLGGRGELFPLDAIVSLLALKTGRPVKLTHSRQEDLATIRVRHPAFIQLRTAFNKDGAILGRKVKLILDTGAYASHGPGVLLFQSAGIASRYNIPHVEIEGYCVYTNKLPAGAVRGYGNPQVSFALESEMDMIAEALGMDPLKLRLINGPKPNQITPAGVKITSCGFSECLQKVEEASGWKQKRGQRYRRGVGAGYVFHPDGWRAAPSDASTAFVHIQDSGKVIVITGESETGQGWETALAQIVAEELGVNLADVSVISGDTDLCPPGKGASASRVTFIGGNAGLAAARDAKEQLKKVAALALEAREDDLVVAGARVFVKGSPDRALTLAEAARASLLLRKGLPILGQGGYDPPTDRVDPKTAKGNFSPAYTFGLQVVEVEVDTETGQVQVLNVYSAHDVGRVINLLGTEGQIEGGAAMGLGYALLEKVSWKDGKVVNDNLADYKIPTALDVPTIHSLLIETVDPEGPYGAKGVGEPGTAPTAAAVANAIYDAVGVRIKELPLTAEALLRALKEKTFS